MPLKISFSTLACPNWSWQEVIDNGSRYGYDGVEVRLIAGEVDLLKVPEFAADQLEKRRGELRERTFRVCGLASSVRFDYPEAEARREQVRIGKAYIDLCVELGASFIRVFGDVLPSEPTVRQQVMTNIAAGLQELGEYAEPRKIDVLIETHGDFSDSRLMRQLLSMVKSSAVGTVWDTHHPWRFCGETIEEALERLKPWVRHTHWKDSVTRLQREHSTEENVADEKARNLMSGHRPGDYVLFGGGEFPAAECLRVLRAAGYDGWYTLEWEKAWHPEIEDPEVALPLFPGKLRQFAEIS